MGIQERVSWLEHETDSLEDRVGRIERRTSRLEVLILILMVECAPSMLAII